MEKLETASFQKTAPFSENPAAACDMGRAHGGRLGHPGAACPIRDLAEEGVDLLDPDPGGDFGFNPKSPHPLLVADPATWGPP